MSVLPAHFFLDQIFDLKSLSYEYMLQESYEESLVI